MKPKKLKNNEENSSKNLSIQFSLDGFSFCIENATTGKPHTFASYDFSVAHPHALLQKIEEIFTADTDLQQDFKNVTAIHQNELATLVPNAYFDESQLKSYLDFNIKTLANDYIDFDVIDAISAKNVYIPYVNINNYLFQHFGEFEFKHYASVLIEKLLKYTTNNTEKQLFVYVSEKYLDIVVTHGKKLLLYNTFSFTTKEDFIYYVLFVAEQLNLNTNEIQLTFLGGIEPESEIYNLTYNYIRNVRFISVATNFFNSSDEFSNHTNYLLLS